MVVGLVVAGLVIGLSGTGDDPPDMPAACELLSEEQLADLLGGTAPEPVIDQAPRERGGKTSTNCKWSGGQADVLVDVDALSATAEAEDQYTSSCAYAGTEASVAGADEACHISAGSDSPGTVNGTRVVARVGQVVVDLTYIKLGELTDVSEQTAVDTTGAVIESLGLPR